MEIPYTVKARPDTGLWNAKIGIWLFLASEVMLFGGMFSGYAFLRTGYEAHGMEWPHHVLNPTIGFINSMILILSSVTIIVAWAQLKLRNFGGYKLWMGLTIALAFAFLGFKSYEYSTKFHHYGIVMKSGKFISGHVEQHGEELHVQTDAKRGTPSEEMTIPLKEVRNWGTMMPKLNTYFALYWAMTGIHVLHVIGGICVLGYFWLMSDKLWKKDPEHVANRVEVGGLYWHFVDIVWIFLFPVLYLL